MVDTMTIYYRFKTYDEYITTKNTVSNYLEKSHPTQKLHGAEQVTYAFADNGIERMYFKQNVSYIIYIKLRPKLMIDRGNYDDVIYSYEVAKLYDVFEKLMTRIGLDDISDLRIWKVQRIDYAVDISVEQDMISRYIKLFHKGNITEKLISDAISKKYRGAANNLYLSGKNYRVNFYDRYTTALMKQEQRPDKYNDISGRYGRIRFEVQLRNVQKIKLPKYVTSNTVDELLDIHLCRKYILRHYDMIVGKGDYYSLPLAICKCKSMTQSDMLELIHESKSISCAKDKFISSSDNKRKAGKQFSEIISKLENAGINPVTLKNGSLKNLRDKLIDELNSSNKVHIRRRRTCNEKE